MSYGVVGYEPEENPGWDGEHEAAENEPAGSVAVGNPAYGRGDEAGDDEGQEDDTCTFGVPIEGFFYYSGTTSVKLQLEFVPIRQRASRGLNRPVESLSCMARIEEDLNVTTCETFRLVKH